VSSISRDPRASEKTRFQRRAQPCKVGLLRQLGEDDIASLGRQHFRGLTDQFDRRAVGISGAFHVDDHGRFGLGDLRQPPQEILGRAEEQGALDFQHDQPVALGGEELALGL
jgi:hypothetical protein